MTEAVLFETACVVAVLVGYGLVRWRLMHATHAFRVQAGCDADRWVADPRVPRTMRRALQGLADGMYRPVVPWLVVLGILIAVSMPYRGFNRAVTASFRLDPDIRDDIARLNVRLAFASLATSPLAGLAGMFILLAGLLAGRSVETVGQRIEAVVGVYPLRA